MRDITVVKSHRNDKQKQISHHIRAILQLIGENPNRAGLQQTPSRVSAMYAEIFAGYQVDPHRILKDTFAESHHELITVNNITYFSHCEHHMLPFFGHVHIGYIPNGKIVGLSKFSELVEALSKKLQLQERFTSQIADVIAQALQPQGVMVVVAGRHLCMAERGVKKPGSHVITTAVRGNFQQDSLLRHEFLTLVTKMQTD